MSLFLFLFIYYQIIIIMFARCVFFRLLPTNERTTVKRRRLFTAVRYGRVPKRSREQLESESKAVVVVVSAADSMAAVQVTTTTVTTTAVVTNAAAGIGIGGGGGGGGGDDPTETADPMNGTTGTTAAAIETNGNGVSVSYDVIAAISQAHLTNCDYTDELTRTLLRKPVASPVSIAPRTA